jgi:hypothetical protein
VLRADHHVAQLARPGGRAGAVDGERQHVGRVIAPAVLAVERAHLLRADEGDRDVPLPHARGGERRGRRVAQPGVVGLDLERQRPWAWRS